MILSMNTVKAFAKIEYSFIKEILSKLETEGNFLNLIFRNLYNRFLKIRLANITPNADKLDAFC